MLMHAESTSSLSRPGAGVAAHEEARRAFQRDGYVRIENAVSASVLERVHADILAEFERTVTAGERFAGGGSLSGHLNCFPGAGSRPVWDALSAAGVVELARALANEPLGMPNVGCNLNLPGSHPQNEHIDGYRASPFMIVNVATVDTDPTNGAMEVLCRTHLRNYKYWQLAWQRPERRRVCLKRGDALLRVSTLWHRGMPNPSPTPRPMLAFTWENGGSKAADPYAAHDGRITFLPNRYASDLRGRLRERVFVAAPRASMALRVLSSVFER